MKIGLLLSCLCTSVMVALGKPSAEAGLASEQAVNHLKAETSSMSRLLFDLAAERYRSVTKRGEVWIFTAHDGSGVKKFSDGEFTIVSLPAFEENDRRAVYRYVAHYNSFNLKAADLKVFAGDYKTARRIYNLLSHFDCPDGPFKEDVEERLKLVAKMEKGEDTLATMEQFKKLYSDFFTFVDLSQIESKKPLVLTNLFEITPNTSLR